MHLCWPVRCLVRPGLRRASTSADYNKDPKQDLVMSYNIGAVGGFSNQNIVLDKSGAKGRLEVRSGKEGAGRR